MNTGSGRLPAAARRALDAVAGHAGGTWEPSADGSGARIHIGGETIAADVVVLGPARDTGAAGAKPRLRFDKVVVRLMDRLRQSCGQVVPPGCAAVVTVTAPIRLAAKTADILEEKIAALAERGSRSRDVSATVHGNRIRIRMLCGGPARASRLVGFVHNPETSAVELLDIASEAHAVGAAGRTRSGRRSGRRWLVASIRRSSMCLEAWRDAYAQLHVEPDVDRVLIVFGDGGVGNLSDQRLP